MKTKGKATIDLQRLHDLEKLESNHQKYKDDLKSKHDLELKKISDKFEEVLNTVFENKKAFMADELYMVVRNGWGNVDFMTYEDAVITFNRNGSFPGKGEVDLKTWFDDWLGYVNGGRGIIQKQESKLSRLDEDIARKNRELESIKEKLTKMNLFKRFIWITKQKF